ncbi:PilX N-terminal domain-containing pilus assembly protein [uncultured Endozoicomonas sp.]|uniref:pilus assembly PilX family protein n=1 Tax=uncultured Endozoicomonas sp. TaxID=432652 RepID=UPI0026136831|nr:PilX N-terminal domain-containing pilus assembly protein [uncultured Endozoicomonas sp.]
MKSMETPVKGSVLLVSLIMLLVITVTGLTAVKMATLEEKMSGNYQDQQMAFFAAEAALKEAEKYIAESSLSLTGFNQACENGFCFSGVEINDVGGCVPGNSEPWEGDAIWSNSSNHRETIVTVSGISASAKYIIEFRCYIAKESEGPLPDPSDLGDWAMYYRITALATGGSSASRVMLQSSYKKSS